jgi:nucleoside-diphosphate-sugar epimerase
MWHTLRRVMAGETIRLFKCYRADFADGERAAAMLWMWRHASESGVFKIGTGTGRSFRDLMLALGAACGRAPVIAYVDMPEAPSGRLRALGDHAPFMPIEEAVRDFVPHHLSQPDPYLEAAVGGWSSSNTRGLRQEETADGPQQALGRHLDHLAGAE